MDQFQLASQGMGKQEWVEACNRSFANSIVDPEWFFSAPDPTLKGVLAPDPDPAWIFYNLWISASRELHVKIALYSWSYNDK
jgi:hypothetical protein